MTSTSLIIFAHTVVHLVFLLGSAQQSDMKDNRLEKVYLLWRLFMIISGNEEVQVPILAVLDGPLPSSLALPSKAFDRYRFFSQWSFFLRLGLFQQIFFGFLTSWRCFRNIPWMGYFGPTVLPCHGWFRFSLARRVFNSDPEENLAIRNWRFGLCQTA